MLNWLKEKFKPKPSQGLGGNGGNAIAIGNNCIAIGGRPGLPGGRPGKAVVKGKNNIAISY